MAFLQRADAITNEEPEIQVACHSEDDVESAAQPVMQPLDVDPPRVRRSQSRKRSSIRTPKHSIDIVASTSEEHEQATIEAPLIRTSVIPEEDTQLQAQEVGDGFEVAQTRISVAQINRRTPRLSAPPPVDVTEEEASTSPTAARLRKFSVDARVSGVYTIKDNRVVNVVAVEGKQDKEVVEILESSTAGERCIRVEERVILLDSVNEATGDYK